jgi:LPXTG-motif cell wall-anchored protein
MKNKNWILLGAGALAAVAATLFLIKKNKKNNDNEKPPKKAPQLNIENPGSQSDFPTAPNPSEIG